MPTVPKKEAMRRLARTLSTMPAAQRAQRHGELLDRWLRDTEAALAHTFGEGSRQHKEFRAMRLSPFQFLDLVDGLRTAETFLQSLSAEVKTYWPDALGGAGPSEEPLGRGGARRKIGATPDTHLTVVGSAPVSDKRKVFIVHGHNDPLKNEVAKLLRMLGLHPIILHEQPNLGRTIIEKFEAHSDVAFAVVLLTSDDRGGPVDVEPDKYQFRARQNVILELGYFMAKLGRRHVAAIYQEGVEVPSDYRGVLFIKHDAQGTWQLQLAKEMKASGINIDVDDL